MKEKIKKLLIFIVLLIFAVMLVGSVYYTKTYTKQDFDVLLYSVKNGVEHTAPDVISSIIKSCIIPLIITLVLLILPIINSSKIKINIKIKNERVQLYPVNWIVKHRKIYILIVGIIACIVVTKCFHIDEFIKNRMQSTIIFEDYYVDARNVEITFPEEKNNLIIIMAESLETTVLSKENGGVWNYKMMPEVEELLKNNTSFSNTNGFGGAYHTYGTDYSAGGNVAITAGIPLKTIDLLSDKNDYTGNGEYLAGAYTMGEILRDVGYNLEIIMGSDGTFGGRTQYYKTNGDYKIFDVNYAIETGKMNEEDRVWWGFSDDDLFKWSKEEITDLSSEDKPFSLIILTADTHFMDGYLSPNAEEKYETQYENVHAYSSKLLGEFVEWLEKQDYYDNTTIVIIGDHLGMQNEFYESRINDNYERTIYNVIINPVIEEKNNKNRKFTTMDMFPTILASIGVEIEGNRIGLGTNLYSGMPTLVEELGYDYFNNELKKNSKFYNKSILGNDFYEMRKRQENNEQVENQVRGNDEENI